MGAFEHMTHPAFFVRAERGIGGGKDHENQVKSPESSKNAKRAKPVRPQKKPLSIEELHRQMMARGLITRLPDPALDIDDDDPDDQPVLIEGEPLSETIIRERR